MDIVNQILDFEVFNMPVGSALMLTAAFGLSDGLSALADRLTGGRIPPLVLQTGIVAGLNNVRAVRKFAGPELTNLVSIAMLSSGINTQFKVTGTVRNLVGSVTGALPAPAPAPVATTEGNLSGHSLGATAVSAPAANQNVDDIDLALLAARGFSV